MTYGRPSVKNRTVSHHTVSLHPEVRTPVYRSPRHAGAAGSLRMLRERSGSYRSSKSGDVTDRSNDRARPGTLMQRFRDAIRALLFLYRPVPGLEVGDLGEVIRARKPVRLPVVMSREEVRAVLANMTGEKRLMASLMYGAGGGCQSGLGEKSHMPHIPAFICHSFTRERLRHPDSPGTAGTKECTNDNDPHARSQQGSCRCSQSVDGL
jgi:hypothetical protein